MMIGSISALVPSRRNEVVELSLKSLIPGTLSTCMTAAVIGLLPA
jgi:CNT family concentrative nucleoside transporter